MAGEEFLIATGSRPSSLGDAYCAVASGTLSTYWNPAGLGDLSFQELSFTHINWFLGTSFDSAAYALPLSNHSGLSICVNRLGSSPVSKADEMTPTDPSFPLPGMFVPSADSLNFSALFGELSYGTTFSKIFHAGITAKLLHEDFVGAGFSGFAFDVGGIIRPFAEATSLGVTLQNLGSELGGYSLPLLLRIGIAKKFALGELMENIGGQQEETKQPRNILASAETSYDFIGQDLGIHLGLEYNSRWGAQDLAVRLGLIEQTSLPFMFTTGFGYSLLLGLMYYHFDYAFVPYASLGEAHRFSLTVDF